MGQDHSGRGLVHGADWPFGGDHIMMQHITAWWRHAPTPDVSEGVYADQYQHTVIRTQILDQYRARWQPETTPATHPALYDPLAPPEGWRYDPYYECWISL